MRDDVELTFGLRVDDYDDIGSNTSPRLAGVWRMTDRHIFKAQYAEAFRPPTLEQSYPGENSPIGLATVGEITPEELASTELSYIYRLGDRKIALTAFYTEIVDLLELTVVPGNPPEFQNAGELITTGIELEWTQQLYDDWQLLANLSYVDAKDKEDEFDNVVTGSIEWLANLALHWQLTSQLSSNLRVKYTGEQEGSEDTGLLEPPAETFDAYTTLDFTLHYDQAFTVNGLSLHFELKNLTDEEWEMQSYPTQWPEGLTNGGRKAYVSVEYAF